MDNTRYLITVKVVDVFSNMDEYSQHIKLRCFTSKNGALIYAHKLKRSIGLIDNAYVNCDFCEKSNKCKTNHRVLRVRDIDLNYINVETQNRYFEVSVKEVTLDS